MGNCPDTTVCRDPSGVNAPGHTHIVQITCPQGQSAQQPFSRAEQLISPGNREQL